MRICYDYQAFAWPKYGGVSRYFVELASRIHRYSGTTVRIVAPLYRNRLLAAKSDVIPVFGLPVNVQGQVAPRVIQLFDSSVSRLLCQAYTPDIVHETYYSRRRTSGKSVKTVITVYDMTHELFPQFFPKNNDTMNIRRTAFARADHLICISESTRADLVRIYGVEEERVSVIHLASSLTAPQDPALAVKDPFFLYVGARAGYKNFAGLLEAFAASLLFKTHRLVCFGGVQFNESENKRRNELGIPQDRVEFVEGDDDLLSRHYASADAFVYPSLYEGFGIPLLEAMECGCPIICNASSSMPEVAGDAAMYCEADDIHSLSSAMLKIVQFPDERRALILRGRLRAKSFSWDQCAQKTHAVYTRVLTGQ
jgi:glycosyltransferase involved in cell wall biosynthesis